MATTVADLRTQEGDEAQLPDSHTLPSRSSDEDDLDNSTTKVMKMTIKSMVMSKVMTIKTMTMTIVMTMTCDDDADNGDDDVGVLFPHLQKLSR